MTRLEFADIQGIVFSAYSHLTSACYIGLSVGDAGPARDWLRDVTSGICFADRGGAQDRALNLAFTFSGLSKLGLAAQALNGFSREFQEGMTGSDYRQRILGDVGDSAPENWLWGGPGNPPLDVLLMLYASDEAALANLVAQCRSHYAEAVTEVVCLDTLALPHQKEHFGFRDGISQPKVLGATRSTDPAEVIQPGEFVLGYENEHGQTTMTPRVDPIQDPDGLLPEDPVSEGLHDFGRNGSYVVFRQLAQDVRAFWRFARAQSNGDADAVALAAKMVGRWPDGAPLTLAPQRSEPHLNDTNQFRYARDGDADGLGCPVGAHIRRANPRDSLEPKPGTDESLTVNRRHRILRRGRSYGPPVDASMDPSALASADDTTAAEPRGLHFLCVNANLSRQFEFVQHAWINNRHFAGLQDETDPLMGARGSGADFTIPRHPVRRRVRDLPGFVSVKGGAYLFLPSRRALQYLAVEHTELASDYAAPASAAVYRAPSPGLRLARRVNTLLEEAILLSRRLVRVRAFFDRHLRDHVVNAVQVILRLRLKDQGLAIAEERIDYREADAAQRITQEMTRFLFTHYRHGGAERAGNTKTYGLVKGSFEVADDLEDHLRVGVFQRGRQYPAYVRFAGPGPLVTPDIRNNGIMSLGIKLMGVEGDKCFDDEKLTQDFTAISAPTFTTPTVFENLKLQRHIGQQTPVFYFLNPFDPHLLDAILQGVYARAHANPLETPFWSCVPYLFGEGRAIKFQLVPRDPPRSQVPRNPAPDYLREAMAATLARQEWCFDFFIQLQTDPVRMPLENSSVIWPDKLSPQIRVATLRLPQQTFDSPQQLDFARNLSFNPWHALTQHRPLGNQGRARRYIYNETSKVRQRINADARVEPTGDEF